MTTRVLFVHGAGEGTYEGSKPLVQSLRDSLGDGYEVDYPVLPNEDEPDPREWSRIIERQSEGAVVVAHSVGASIALQRFSETGGNSLLGLVTIAAPFWGGDGWHYDGFEALTLPHTPLIVAPLTMFHGQDDEVVPVDHLALFAAAFPSALTQVIKSVGHDLGNDASVVARGIQSLLE